MSHRRGLTALLAALSATLLAVPAHAAPASHNPPAAQIQSADPPADCRLPNRTFLGEGTTNWANFPRPIGRVRAAVLFRGNWNIDAEMAKYKPAEQWYLNSSFGRYQLELVPVRRPVVAHLDHPAADAVGDVSVTNASTWGDAARSVDRHFDFSTTDIVFLTDSGTSRSYAQFDNVTLDGRTIKAGAVLGTDWGNHRHLLLAHEGGHTISLPDLYGGPGGHGYIGSWDLMGNLGGVAPDHFAWHKWKLGWLDDNQVSCVRTVNTSVTTTLSPVETAGGVKAVVIRYGTTVAYVAEVRARSGNDSRACRTGVLVYRVDSAVASGSGPVRVVDSRRRPAVAAATN
nr:M6 family metalloprotease domain-containing protein [Saccharothrix mutabilis subsp. capreolus]